MKKRIMVLVFLTSLVIAFAGVTQAWQGRMGGMGDPYGQTDIHSAFSTQQSRVPGTNKVSTKSERACPRWSVTY